MSHLGKHFKLCNYVELAVSQVSFVWQEPSSLPSDRLSTV